MKKFGYCMSRGAFLVGIFMWAAEASSVDGDTAKELTMYEVMEAPTQEIERYLKKIEKLNEVIAQGLTEGADETFSEILGQLFPTPFLGASATPILQEVVRGTQRPFLSMVQNLIDYLMELYSPSQEVLPELEEKRKRAERILKKISRQIPNEYSQSYVKLLLADIRNQEGKPSEIEKGRILREALMSLRSNQFIPTEDTLSLVNELLKNGGQYGDEKELLKLKTELELGISFENSFELV